MFFDAEDWLGTQAKLEGTLTLRQAGSKDWEADFQGDLLDVDLGKLVGRALSPPSAHRTDARSGHPESSAGVTGSIKGIGWIEAEWRSRRRPGLDRHRSDRCANAGDEVSGRSARPPHTSRPQEDRSRLPPRSGYRSSCSQTARSTSPGALGGVASARMSSWPRSDHAPAFRQASGHRQRSWA